MKTILFMLLFLLVPKLASSQIFENDKKIYLDSTFVQTTRINNHYYSMQVSNINKNRAYYRIIKDYYLDKNLYIFNDYYKSGVMYSHGTSGDKDVLWRQGEFVFYYENGNKKSVANFNNGVQEGKDLEFYENGNTKQERTYMGDSKDSNSIYKIDQFWDINGIQKVIDGNGYYEESKSDSYSAGNVKDGFKNGIWNGWVRNPENKYTEEYEKGKLISGKIVDENKIETTYTVLETRAQPKNGSLHFYDYLKKNIRLPDRFKDTKDGIYIEFTIDKEGK